MVHKSVIERFVGKLDSELEIVVALVQLVPEEQIGLRTQEKNYVGIFQARTVILLTCESWKSSRLNLFITL